MFSEIIVKMDTAIPSLEVIIKEVEKFVDDAVLHDASPHVIDVQLPMLCSYLPYWWNVGPDNVSPNQGWDKSFFPTARTLFYRVH